MQIENIHPEYVVEWEKDTIDKLIKKQHVISDETHRLFKEYEETVEKRHMLAQYIQYRQRLETATRMAEILSPLVESEQYSV